MRGGLSCNILKDYDCVFCVATILYRLQRLQMFVLCSGQSFIFFKEYICAFLVMDYRVAVSTPTYVHSMLWSIVYRFHRSQLCVLCSGLSFIGFEDYYCAFCVVDKRVTFSTNLTVRSTCWTIA